MHFRKVTFNSLEMKSKKLVFVIDKNLIRLKSTKLILSTANVKFVNN